MFSGKIYVIVQIITLSSSHRIKTSVIIQRTRRKYPMYLLLSLADYYGILLVPYGLKIKLSCTFHVIIWKYENFAFNIRCYRVAG